MPSRYLGVHKYTLCYIHRNTPQPFTAICIIPLKMPFRGCHTFSLNSWLSYMAFFFLPDFFSSTHIFFVYSDCGYRYMCTSVLPSIISGCMLHSCMLFNFIYLFIQNRRSISAMYALVFCWWL